MWRVYGGAVAFLAGVSAFIVDARHRRTLGLELIGSLPAPHRSRGLSNTAYDLIHVGGWVLIVAGVLLMIMGLIRYAATVRA